MIPADHKRALMTEHTSRQNKLWLVSGWMDRYPWFIEWKWQGEPMRSRLLFRFGPDESFVAARSFDEDVVPTFKFGKETTT